jgi:hypothetical protein
LLAGAAGPFLENLIAPTPGPSVVCARHPGPAITRGDPSSGEVSRPGPQAGRAGAGVPRRSAGASSGPAPGQAGVSRGSQARARPSPGGEARAGPTPKRGTGTLARLRVLPRRTQVPGPGTQGCRGPGYRSSTAHMSQAPTSGAPGRHRSRGVGAALAAARRPAQPRTKSQAPSSGAPGRHRSRAPRPQSQDRA